MSRRSWRPSRGVPPDDGGDGDRPLGPELQLEDEFRTPFEEEEPMEGDRISWKESDRAL